MQYSIHSPNSFIYAHWQRLLPAWSLPVASVLVVLQHCPVDLVDRTLETEILKNQLRQRFLEFGSSISNNLQQMGYLATVFDPCTGIPINSISGELRLDDVAVVRSLLGYAIVNQGGCSVVLHPRWGGAVYPSVLLSSASCQTVERVVRSLDCDRSLPWQITPTSTSV